MSKKLIDMIYSKINQTIIKESIRFNHQEEITQVS